MGRRAIRAAAVALSGPQFEFARSSRAMSTIISLASACSVWRRPSFDSASGTTSSAFTLNRWFSVAVAPTISVCRSSMLTPRYDEAAATLAWSRTVAFFDEHLKH